MKNFIKEKYRELICLIINLFLFVSSLIITILGVLNGAGSGQVGENIEGLNYFKPYTIDSNVFLGIVALIFCIFLIINFLKKKEIPHWVYSLYYVATVTITITILTVIFFLFPTSTISGGIEHGLTLFVDDMFFFHVLNPILAAVSYFFNKQSFKLKWSENFLALIPIGVYTVIYTLNVAVFKTWNDFYGFTFGGKFYLTPIIIVIMMSFAFLLSFIYRIIKNKQIKIQ